MKSKNVSHHRYLQNPYDFNAVPVQSGRARFSASAVLTNAGFTTADLISLPGLVTTVLNTTAVPLAATVRLKKIAVWASVTTAGTPVSVSITPVQSDSTLNLFDAMNVTQTDTSVSYDRPAYVELSAVKNTFIGGPRSALVNVSSAIVNITAPSGSIIDISYEYILNLAQTSPGILTYSVSGSAVGTMGRYKTLCGVAVQPIGVNKLT